MKKEKVEVGDKVIVNYGAFQNVIGYVKKVQSSVSFYHIKIDNVRGSILYLHRNEFKLYHEEEYTIKTTLL